MAALEALYTIVRALLGLLIGGVDSVLVATVD